MVTKKALFVFQLLAFVLLTVSTIMVGYYFPNLPPVLRQVLPRGAKGSIKLVEHTGPNNRFLKWFNRDPEREIPTKPRILVSPADGVVCSVKSEQDAKHVVIEMRYTDVHVQRVPIDGMVLAVEGEGKELQTDVLVEEYMLDKMLPFQKITTLKTEIGTVKIRQITSFFAKRIEVYVKKGQMVTRGERLGRVLAGSTIVLEVPRKVSIFVEENQEVFAGETIIGKY